MSPPSDKQQLTFLSNLQRLLSEGQFVATYKYALLLSLAELAVESGDDSGDALPLSTGKIAEKFVLYYWRQVVPYVPRANPTEGQVLRQNTGQQAAIIRQLIGARQQCGGSLVAAKRDPRAWQSLVRRVERVVQKMPLWKLQTVGNTSFDFLYDNVGQGGTIVLRPGVAYCLRRFYGLIGDLVRGAWIRYVRRHNHEALGTTADLTEFLFGSERSDLGVVRNILVEVQSGRCFYCTRPLAGIGDVDHFIPWSKYPFDLGHNFVVAHKKCNSAKADHLAAADYLAAWCERNKQHQEQLETEFTQQRVLHDLSTSVRIAHWAYSTAFQVGGLTWVRANQMAQLPAEWKKLLE